MSKKIKPEQLSDEIMKMLEQVKRDYEMTVSVITEFKEGLA